MAYIDTDADLKPYLGIAGAVTGDDALLDGICTRTKAIIDAYCRRTFEASANTDRTFDAVRDVDNQVLRLDSDLCEINSITNGDGTIVTTAQYTTEPRNMTPYYAIRLLNSSGVAWMYTTDPEDSITISGKWAYSTAAPDDIVQAALRLGAYIYRQKDNSLDLDRTIIAGASTILPMALPADIKVLLAPYRRLI